MDDPIIKSGLSREETRPEIVELNAKFIELVEGVEINVVISAALNLIAQVMLISNDDLEQTKRDLDVTIESIKKTIEYNWKQFKSLQ